MSEQTIISIVTALVTVIAVLTLFIRSMLDRKSRNGNGKAGNPISLHDFIVDCSKEHVTQIGLLENIKETLNRIEEKIKGE